jgi:spermidine synthase
MSNGAFEDPRVELVIEDGIDFVKKQEDGIFDVVIVDSIDPNPNSVGEVLFTQEFY